MTHFHDPFTGQRIAGNFGPSYLDRRALATPQAEAAPQADRWACAMPADVVHAPIKVCHRYAIKLNAAPQPAPKDGEWVTEWEDGVCPVDPNSMLDCRMEYSTGDQAVVNGVAHYFTSSGGVNDWYRKQAGQRRMLAYRIIRPAATEAV